MNKSFSIMGLLSSALFLGHTSFGMEQATATFSCFSQLQPELQLQIFAHADNKTSFQEINHNWHVTGSIRNESIFSPSFCNIMYAKNNGQERLCGILLCAAYKHNYLGVQNILKNSKILEHFNENRVPFHYIGRYDKQHHILDLYGMQYSKGPTPFHYIDLFKNQPNTVNFHNLLLEHKISVLKDAVSEPTFLKIACMAGDSNMVQRFISIEDVNTEEMDRLINLAIDFDHGKCLTILITCYVTSSIKNLLTNEHLFRACSKKSTHALDVLLKTECFDINRKELNCTTEINLIDGQMGTYVMCKEGKVNMNDFFQSKDGEAIFGRISSSNSLTKITPIYKTFLNDVMDLEQKHGGYGQVIMTLRKHGAQTIEELEKPVYKMCIVL